MNSNEQFERLHPHREVVLRSSLITEPHILQHTYKFVRQRQYKKHTNSHAGNLKTKC